MAGCFCSLMIVSSGQWWFWFHLHCWMRWIDILDMFLTYLDVEISGWKGKDQLFVVIVVDIYRWAGVLVYSGLSSVPVGLWEAASDDEVGGGKIFTWSLSGKKGYVKDSDKLVKVFRDSVFGRFLSTQKYEHMHVNIETNLIIKHLPCPKQHNNY